MPGKLVEGVRRRFQHSLLGQSCGLSSGVPRALSLEQRRTLISVLIAPVVRAFTFNRYVNPTSGSDSNEGLSPAAAWRSFASAAALTLGTSIGVARGATLTDSAVGGTSISIGTYGPSSRANPIFDIRVPITGWALTGGGHTNVYQVTLASTANVKWSGNIWKNGTMLVQVLNLAALDAAAAGTSFYCSDWTSATPTVYIKEVADPATTSDVYLWPSGAGLGTGIQITGDGWTLENVETIGSIHEDGSVRAIGRNGTLRNTRHSGGSRHSFYAKPGLKAYDCYFIAGRNDLEGSSNAIVINDTVTTGEGFEIYGGGIWGIVGANGTGPDMHDGTLGTLMGTQIMQGVWFKDLVSWGSPSGSDVRVDFCLFDNVTGGGGISTAGVVLNVRDSIPGSTLDQLYNNSAACTINSRRNDITCRSLPVGFYRTNAAGGDVALTIDTDTLRVQDTATASARVIHHQRGAVAMTDTRILTPNASGLCAQIDDIIVAGFSGGTATYTGDRNTFPYGSRFQLNGVTSPDLAAWQAATGQDANSVLTQPTPVGSDSFTRADENLENTTWVRVGGAAAQAGVRSNQLACIGTTQSLYRFANAASVEHYIDFLVASVPGTAGPYVVLRASDQNNWVGVRWTGTAWQIGRCIAGVLVASVNGSSVVAPAVGQLVRMSMKGDLVWLYVNGRTLIRGAAMAATAIGANVGVGVVPRGSVVNPLIDDFKFGLV